MGYAEDEERRIQIKAARERINHLYCGEPPEDDYWGTYVYNLNRKEGSAAPVSFNPYVSGTSAYISNVWASMGEAIKQQEPVRVRTPVTGTSTYISNVWASMGEAIKHQEPVQVHTPSPDESIWERTKNYEGPLGGGGFFGLFAPAPGSPEYEAYVAKKTEEKSAPPITPNKTPTPSTSTWSNFVSGVKGGYNLEPKPGQVGEPTDRNVFQESLEKWGAGISNIAKVPNYATYLVVGGAVLLLLLVIKR